MTSRATIAAAMAAALALGTPLAVTADARPWTAVSVWETTADQSKLLTQLPGATFGRTTAGAPTISIDQTKRYQSITGFGASFTDSSAWLVANSPQRDAIMTKLFDPRRGIGLDFLRQPIGASDFSRSLFSYDSGPADPTLSRFSVAHDQDYILPLLRQALRLNPQTTVMATPWSGPDWMKTSGSMIGGSIKNDDQTFRAYATYLVKFVQAYRKAGVPVSLLSAQNEPEYSPADYPGATMSAADQARFIGDYLGPALRAAGLKTGILAYDHNWDDTKYPSAVLGDAQAAKYTSGVAWHCYGGNPDAQSTVHDAFPTKDAYFTECSGSQSANHANTFADSLDWQTEHLIIGGTRNWAKSVVTWNVALDPSGGPTMHCTTCTGAVTVDNTADSVSYNAEYYVLGQASKFVKPGAVRIDSNTFGAGNVEDVAFRNPDGSTALVVLNADPVNARAFNVSEHGRSFGYTLPAKAVATFTWR